jgi:hypothetical protein
MIVNSLNRISNTGKVLTFQPSSLAGLAGTTTLFVNASGVLSWRIGTGVVQQVSGGGGAIWGGIVGALSNQTDLQTALDGKADDLHIHSSTITTEVAGENISGGRLLEYRNNQVFYHNPDEIYEPYGISNSAAITGANVDVTLSGNVTMVGWGLTTNATYYANTNGTINTSPNLTGRSQIIGIAINSNTLNLNIQQSIYY